MTAVEALVDASSSREVVPVEDVKKLALQHERHAAAYRDTAAMLKASMYAPGTSRKHGVFLDGCTEAEERIVQDLNRLAGELPF